MEEKERKKEKEKRKWKNEFVLHELTKAVLKLHSTKWSAKSWGALIQRLCSASLFIFGCLWWILNASRNDDEYVCETLRALQVRAKEHRDAIRLGNTEKSAVAQHVHQQKEPHEIYWSTMSVIDRAQAWR